MKYIAKTLLTLAFAMMALGPIGAQERLTIDFYSRIDYNYVDGTDASIGETSGFKGRFVMVRADGDLGNGFAFHISHRLNKINKDPKFFDSTDWAFLTYTTPDGGWDFSGGKIIQFVGSYEYEDNPIDVPFFSQYACHCNPYLPGVSVGRFLPSGDKLTLSCTSSPYNPLDMNYLTYALEWRGEHGIWHPIYTANYFEQPSLGPVYQIALGNMFLSGKWEFKLDYIQRFNSDRSSWSHNDFTSAALCRYALTDHWTLFGKATCDINDNTLPFDGTVGIGTNSQIYAAGFEFFPDKKHDIKLYGFFQKSVGEFEYLPNDYCRAVFGLKWKVNMFTLK